MFGTGKMTVPLGDIKVWLYFLALTLAGIWQAMVYMFRKLSDPAVSLMSLLLYFQLLTQNEIREKEFEIDEYLKELNIDVDDVSLIIYLPWLSCNASWGYSVVCPW